MPGADRPLPPPEPFREEVQLVEPQQLQAPLNMPVERDLLEQQRLSLGDKEEQEQGVRQVSPTTVLPTDIPSESVATTPMMEVRSEAIWTKSNTIDERDAIPDVPPAASERGFVAADVATTSTGNSGYNSRGMTHFDKQTSYLLESFSMLHRDGRLEEAAATLEQALGIMEGRRRQRRDDARAATTIAAVNSNIPENKLFPAHSSIADGEGNTPYRGVEEMAGASRGKDGVAQEYSSHNVGPMIGPEREFLREDKHLESSVAVAEASAIAGVMNDLGCTLQQVMRDMLPCLLNAWLLLYTIVFKVRAA